MSLAIAPIAASSNPLANSPTPPTPLGAGPGDSSGQIEAALAAGGQVESNNSFVQFRFVDGRLTIVGRVTDITLVVPTHDSTGLASSRLPVSKAPDPLQAALLGDIAAPTTSTRTPLQAELFAETHPFAGISATPPVDSAQTGATDRENAINTALDGIQIAPTNYGGSADLRGLLGSAVA
jgi:hypothetical protein